LLQVFNLVLLTSFLMAANDDKQGLADFIESARHFLTSSAYRYFKKFHDENGYEDLATWQDDLQKFDDSQFVDAMRQDNFDNAKMQRVWGGLRIAIGIDKLVTSLHELNFQVSDAEVADVRKELEPQFSGFSESGKSDDEKEQSLLFWKLTTVAQKNYMPNLVPILNDIYQCYRIRERPNPVDDRVIDWTRKSQYLSEKFDERQRNMIVYALESFNKRVFNGPPLRPMQQVNDSLNEFVNIICFLRNAIKSTLQGTKDTKDTKEALQLPLQVDLWIIPKNKHQENVSEEQPDFGDDDDDDDDSDDNDSEDEGGDSDEKEADDGDDEKDDLSRNLEQLLQSEIEVTTEQVIVNLMKKDDKLDDVFCIRPFKECLRKLAKSQTRLCLILDRREKHQDKESGHEFYNLHGFLPPPPYADIGGGKSSALMLCHTKKCMIPSMCSSPPQVSTTSASVESNNQQMMPVVDRQPPPMMGAEGEQGIKKTKRDFVFSFIIHEREDIEAYLWLHGCCTRFFASYFSDLLPKYFVDEKQTQVSQKNVEQYFMSKSTPTRQLFEAWKAEINRVKK